MRGGAGPGGPRAPPARVERLAVHHLDRRCRGLRDPAFPGARAGSGEPAPGTRPGTPRRASGGAGARRGAPASGRRLPRDSGRARHRSPRRGGRRAAMMAGAGPPPPSPSPSRRSIVIHAHFYQPPREEPWLELVEREAGAAPFHDWNQRIERECYRAVVAARIPGTGGRIARIVNTLEQVSFNVGPTLAEWLPPAGPPPPSPSPPPRQADRGPLGNRRLPPPLRAGAFGDVASGNRGGRRDARRPRRGGDPLHHPGTAPGGGAAPRGTAGAVHHHRRTDDRPLPLRRVAVARGRVRPADLRCGPVDRVPGRRARAP